MRRQSLRRPFPQGHSPAESAKRPVHYHEVQLPSARRLPSAPDDGEPQGVLLSFDIDGTLQDGDPPGPLTMELPRLAITLGYTIGSASDRTLGEQSRLWQRHDIAAAFVSHKHTLTAITVQFPAGRRVHIGDTALDAHYARLAGFEFVDVNAIPAAGTPGWIF
jgi:hypothetical protein